MTLITNEPRQQDLSCLGIKTDSFHNHSIRFHSNNKVIGKLYWSDSESILKFEGDVDETAKVFLNSLCKQFNQLIEQIKLDAARAEFDRIISEKVSVS